MSYNTKEVKREGKTFVFVTRGRSKDFSDDEVNEFFSQQETGWEGIPDNKQRKIMFLKDLKMGLEFCMGKYGATREEIELEAIRIAPYYRMSD